MMPVATNESAAGLSAPSALIDIEEKAAALSDQMAARMMDDFIFLKLFCERWIAQGALVFLFSGVLVNYYTTNVWRCFSLAQAFPKKFFKRLALAAVFFA